MLKSLQCPHRQGTATAVFGAKPVHQLAQVFLAGIRCCCRLHSPSCSLAALCLFIRIRFGLLLLRLLAPLRRMRFGFGLRPRGLRPFHWLFPLRRRALLRLRPVRLRWRRRTVAPYRRLPVGWSRARAIFCRWRVISRPLRWGRCPAVYCGRRKGARPLRDSRRRCILLPGIAIGRLRSRPRHRSRPRSIGPGGVVGLTRLRPIIR